MRKIFFSLLSTLTILPLLSAHIAIAADEKDKHDALHINNLQLFNHIQSHSVNMGMLRYREDIIALLTYSITSIEIFSYLFKQIALEQQKSILLARKSFMISDQHITPIKCIMYCTSPYKTEKDRLNYKIMYRMIESLTINQNTDYRTQTNRYVLFLKTMMADDSSYMKKNPEACDLYYSTISSPCDSLGFSYKKGASKHYNSSRLQRERYLLCRMASDIAALSRILELMQGEERIPNNAKQIRITAKTLKDCAADLLKRLNAHSYPLAVRESDPAFEGDPFAVFQAYQRQAEAAERSARAALEALPRVRRQ